VTPGVSDGLEGLPPLLRPYAALLFDGMGGANGLLPGDVCRLTLAQVAAWYAGPMAAMRRQADAGGGGAAAAPPFEEFVRKFSALGVRKTHEGWVAAYRRHHGGTDRG
jgi:hypothetical protein